MVHQFKATNFLSIREEQMLDFTASSSDKMYEEYTVTPIRNYRISKLGVIYGANASGKSNILIALNWLLNFTIDKNASKHEEIPGLTPFLLDAESRTMPTSMYLSFFIEDVRYEYSICLDSKKIHEEEFHFYPNNRRVLIYSRKWIEEKRYSKLTWGNVLKLNLQQKMALQNSSTQGRTTLAGYMDSNIEVIPIFEHLVTFFMQTTMPLLSGNTNIGGYANNKIKKNEECRKFVCQVLEKADFNISDLSIKEQEKELDDETWNKMKALAQLMEGPIPEDKHIVTDDLLFTHKTSFYQETFRDELESMGTKRMYGMAVILYYLVKYNTILIADELETSLHYDLLVYFIKMFLINSKRGQLIFSTHSLMLLDEPIIRRDMIFFSEKNASGATEIFKAKAFGLHKDVSILNAYRAGKLGAKPEVGSVFLDLEE